MENKRKHLEMIQGVVNRLSTNSFLLKGWSVVLVSALFALSAPDSRIAFVYLAYIPAIIFWGYTDGFHCPLAVPEQLFRKLYDQVRAMPEEDIDFSMNTEPSLRATGDRNLGLAATLCGEVFLKASCASGSDFGCCGRADRRRKPRLAVSVRHGDAEALFDLFQINAPPAHNPIGFGVGTRPSANSSFCAALRVDPAGDG